MAQTPAAHLDDATSRGRAARASAPRSAHGDWTPAGRRPDPLATLGAQDAARVPELVPIRYGRMATSPFAFFRGAAAVMAADLAHTPASGLAVQLCGDAHLANFGVFAAPDRRLVFDINDFDETGPGPWEWDVKRLAASVAVAARACGIDAAGREGAVSSTVARYRSAMRTFAAMRHLDVWYARIEVEDLLDIAPQKLGAARARRFVASVEKARRKDSVRALGRLTEVADGVARFRSDPPLLVRAEDLLSPGEAHDVGETLRILLGVYRESLRADARRLLDRYRPVDIARKVVGVGSVGTRAWIVLLLGDRPDDPLVLQVKEAQASVLEAHLGSAGIEHHGQRVVEGQRLMQATSDVLLGWLRATGFDGRDRDFYVRQLWDGKASADLTAMDAAHLAVYGRVCGWALARAHARSGDAAAIGAYLGKGDAFDRAMVRFAEAYADQNERDHAALLAAVEDGAITVQRDV